MKEKIIHFNQRVVDNDSSDSYTSSIPVYYQKYHPYSYSNPLDFLRLELNANTVSDLNNDGAWSTFQLFPNYYNLYEYYNNNREYTITGLRNDDCVECLNEYKK